MMRICVRRVPVALLGLVWMAVVTGSVSVPAALGAGSVNRGECPSSTESSPGFRPYLPDCRAYEAVTPPYKEGGTIEDADMAAVSADGSQVITGVGGAFAGSGNYWWEGNEGIQAYFQFTRVSGGWQPAALTPPATSYPHSQLMAASADLSTTLWGAARTSAIAASRLSSFEVYLRHSGGELLPVGPGTAPQVTGETQADGLSFVGASHDLTHELFYLPSQELHGHSDLWPGDTTRAGSFSLYEYVYAGHPDVEPILVGVKNQEPLRSDREARLISDCGTEFGSASSKYNAVSEGGSVVFFTALHHARDSSECASPAVNELYARVEGSSTVAISEPSGEDCETCNTTAEPKDATFVGASANGEKVFFLTEQKLLSGQEGMNLYEYDFDGPQASAQHPTGKITLVSSGSPTPEVQGVVRVSGDGSHVYFVAQSVLTGANGEGRLPEAGADNLYVYEPDPARPDVYRVVFVATLLNGAEEATLRAEEEAEAGTVAERSLAKAIAAEEEALNSGAGAQEAFGRARTSLPSRSRRNWDTRSSGHAGQRSECMAAVRRSTCPGDARRPLPGVPQLGRSHRGRCQQGPAAVRVRRAAGSADACVDRTGRNV